MTGYVSPQTPFKQSWLAGLVSVCLFLGLFTTAHAASIVDLSGRWDFALGLERDYTTQVSLPGSMLTNGLGNEPDMNTPWVASLYDSSYYFNPKMAPYRRAGNVKFPFFLTPDKHYVGHAWYGKSVDVPKDWKGQRVLLFLERVHIESRVLVNGREAGRDSSLSTPHVFDITSLVKPGRRNRLDILIYNGIEHVGVGKDSHSVTDQTQGCWNGIVGRMELQCRPLTYLDDVQIYPDPIDKSLMVKVALKSPEPSRRGPIAAKAGLHRLEARIDSLCREFTFQGDTLTMNLSLGEAYQCWDEFHPNLYTLRLTLDGADRRDIPFALSRIGIEGRQFLLNGRPVWFRGTVGNCCFPLTGYPPCDEESWMAIFRKCKEYGLNLMRFHSYCPPEAAFSAADKLGFYLQPEGPSWPNHGVRLGKGQPIDRYLLEETQRMVKAYGNHPSFCFLSAGNEPAGDWVRWTGDFVDYWVQTGDLRRVYCCASVGGSWAWDPKSQFHVKAGARGLDWDNRAPQSTDDYFNQITYIAQKGKPVVVNEVPFISHEKGQWCVFPDFREIERYTGPYKAGNFEIFRDLLREGGMERQAEKFLQASGKLQTLAYKYEIERNLRTPDYAGFQMLSLNDYSGQGSALVGVLNVFWEEKGYCQAADWRAFCSPVVPLARFPKFVYTNAETLDLDIELYNAGAAPLINQAFRYRITDAKGGLFAEGLLSEGDFPLGKNLPLGRLSLPLSSIDTPTRLTLTVEGGPAANRWDFWVYPATEAMPEHHGVYLCDTLDTQACRVLEQGGKVLICAAGKVRFGNDIRQTYLPVFWNTSWFKMRPPHTTGALIDTDHPLFRRFDTEDWAELQWWELLNQAQVINLRDFPADYQPPVQPIDTWHLSRKLGMLFEAKVLNGKLLMTTIDIDTDLDRRVVARHLRRALLDYMASEDFQPSLSLDRETVLNLFEHEAPGWNHYTLDSPDELKKP